MWLRLGVVAATLAIALFGGGLDPFPVLVLAILAAVVVACVGIELAMHHRHGGEAAAPPSVEAA